MPTFSYFGQTLTIDTLYSYARVSSDIQTIEAGGEGIPRQLELYEEFAAQYGITADNLTGQQFIDSGLSGSKGEHLKTGAGLAAFMKMAVDNKLGANPGLTVESFSRLGRLPIDRFNELFWALMRAGVTLITLKDHRAYSKASVRHDKGQVYQIQAAMQAASSYAEDLAYYTAKSWKVRRGTASSLAPAWFDKFADGVLVTQFKGAAKNAKLELRPNPDKLKVIERIFADILTMGVDRLAKTLNQQGVPTFAGSGAPWGQAHLANLIRSRMVLGEQAVGKYIEGVRTKTGEVIKDAYPAVITEDQWMQANAELDRRKKGVANGRNVTAMTNLFGDMAQCDTCNGRMKIRQKGRVGQFRYLGCSNAGVGKCANKRYFRLDMIEKSLFKYIGVRALSGWERPEPEADPAEAIAAKIAAAKAEAKKIEVLYERSMERSGELAERTQAKLEGDHAAKRQEIKVMERELSAIKAKPPIDVQAALLVKLTGSLDGLKGEELIHARRHVATILPTFVTAIRFRSDGRVLTVEPPLVHKGIEFPSWPTALVAS